MTAMSRDLGDGGDYSPLLSLYDFPPPWRHPVENKFSIAIRIDPR